MLNLFYHIVYLLLCIYVLAKSISYGVYEIKEEKNKYGGIVVILITIFDVIFSNIIVWQN